MIKIDDVVQFNKNHEWFGCLGIVTEVKTSRNDIRYLVEVLTPLKGSTFMYVMESENALEKIGKAILTLEESDQQ